MCIRDSRRVAQVKVDQDDLIALIRKAERQVGRNGRFPLIRHRARHHERIVSIFTLLLLQLHARFMESVTEAVLDPRIVQQQHIIALVFLPAAHKGDARRDIQMQHVLHIIPAEHLAAHERKGKRHDEAGHHAIDRALEGTAQIVRILSLIHI